MALRSRAVLVMPDGIAGAFYASPRREVLYVAERKGFVRLALEQGAYLVPVYFAGHTHVYERVWPGPDSWAARLSRAIRFSLIAFWNSELYWMPRPACVTMRIGEPIPPPPPAAADGALDASVVDAHHALFVRAMQALHAEHHGASAPPLIIL